MTTSVGASQFFQQAAQNKQALLDQLHQQEPPAADGTPAERISKDNFVGLAGQLVPQGVDPGQIFDDFNKDGQQGLTDHEAEAALNRVLEGGLQQGTGMDSGGPNPDVAILQNQLNNVKPEDGGPDPSTPLDEDGQFGPLTQAALVQFQQQNNLPPTGQVDADTANLLQVKSGVVPQAGAPAADPNAPAADPNAPPAGAAAAPPPPFGTVTDTAPPTAGTAAVADALPRPGDPNLPPGSPPFNDAVNKALAAVDPKNPNSQDLKAIAFALHQAGDENRSRAANLLATSPQAFSSRTTEALVQQLQNPGKNTGDLKSAIFGDRKSVPSPEELTAAGLAAQGTDPSLGGFLTAAGNPNVSPDVRKNLAFGLDGDGNSGDFKRAMESAMQTQPPKAEDLQALQQMANWEAVCNNNNDKRFFDAAQATLGVVNQNFKDLSGNAELMKNLGSLVQADNPKDFAKFFLTAAGSADTPIQQDTVRQLLGPAKDKAGVDDQLATEVNGLLAIGDPGLRRAQANDVRGLRDQRDKQAAQTH